MKNFNWGYNIQKLWKAVCVCNGTAVAQEVAQVIS